MTKKKKKYFPNNYDAYASAPTEWFESIPFDQFVDWKMAGWELPSSVDCIIREETKSGKIKEYIYSRPRDAKYRIKKMMDAESQFTVATQDEIHYLEPRYLLKEDYDDPLA
tara:strand:- start:840 stop:1172 length:333 start_codon:yes stop_codon:yes gene_type:complete